MIETLKSRNVRGMWPELEPVLRPAVTRYRGLIETDDVLARLENQHYQCWFSREGGQLSVGITEVINFPRGKVVRAVFGAGHLSAIIEGLDCASSWARDIGALGLMAEGRPGWGRALPACYERDGAIFWRSV